VTTFATPLNLNERIRLALAHLRAARYDSNPAKIAANTKQMDSMLERIACRPLREIDPVLHQRLTVSWKLANRAGTAIRDQNRVCQ
jgi:hypothetical protein